MPTENAALHRKIAIMAGNYQQFCLYLREHNIDRGNAVFARPDHDGWRGFEFSEVITVGTWYEHPDSQELLEMLKTRVR